MCCVCGSSDMSGPESTTRWWACNLQRWWFFWLNNTSTKTSAARKKQWTEKNWTVFQTSWIFVCQSKVALCRWMRLLHFSTHSTQKNLKTQVTAQKWMLKTIINSHGWSFRTSHKKRPTWQTPLEDLKSVYCTLKFVRFLRRTKHRRSSAMGIGEELEWSAQQYTRKQKNMKMETMWKSSVGAQGREEGCCVDDTQKRQQI